ncbi:SHOCT domain-containing protein [Ectothiorhodospiraceae bacterium 2226]|nr:SHOCT domain-containing protein [Ectothiorhodospiraceae bacterium 2226]
MLVLMVVVALAWAGGMHRDGHWQAETSAQEAPKAAFELLDERDARGDISREEYLQKREDLLRERQ